MGAAGRQRPRRTRPGKTTLEVAESRVPKKDVAKLRRAQVHVGFPRANAILTGDGRRFVACPAVRWLVLDVRLRRAAAATAGADHDPRTADQNVPDLLKPGFIAPAPNHRYVADITYLLIAAGTNRYLATVIDCHSRRLAGWAIADHVRTRLVEDALREARAVRGNFRVPLFHGDQG